MQRHLELLCTDSRSCCCSSRTTALADSIEDNSITLTTGSLDDAGSLGPLGSDAADQQARHATTAVLCAYWDQIVPTAPGSTAAEEGPAHEMLLKWASVQLQKLRMLVSGTIVSNVLLAGDLISLICGLALNGDVALEINAQDTPRQAETLLNPQQEADAAAAAAAAKAGAEDAAEPGFPRGWLRLCRTATAETAKPNTSGMASRSCCIHPRVYNLRQVRGFVLAHLKKILEIGGYCGERIHMVTISKSNTLMLKAMHLAFPAAKERGVVIQLPTEVLLQVGPQPAAPATATTGTAAEGASRGRRTSDGVGGSQRNSTKKPRGSAKVEPLEGHIEDTGAGDVSGSPASEEEKPPSVLAVCHLPPADLLWKVVFMGSSDLCVPPEGDTSNTTARRRSEEGMEPSRASGIYATMTQQAVDKAVASFGGPSHFLWLGDKLSRENEGIQNLLDAARTPDATVVMVESLVKAKKYSPQHPTMHAPTVVRGSSPMCLSSALDANEYCM